MIEGPEQGWASSVMVCQCSWIEGGWQWSASGPHGMTMGGAASEEDAWRKAREAQAALNQSMRPRGVG
jgi:hypothetical protein